MKTNPTVSHLNKTAQLDPHYHLCQELNTLLADAFVLYIKTKNFHWHVSGPQFYSLHLLFDEQAHQILKMTDQIAERIRQKGGQTLHSLAHIQKWARLKENEEVFIGAQAMLTDLREDNLKLDSFFKKAHVLASADENFATAGFIEKWMEQAQKRAWFLLELTNN